MRRIKLTIAYDGTNYVGFQYQPNGISIEEVLNKALKKLLHEDISVIGASRTDSHVHADGNIAVFDTEAKMAADKFKYALNEFLPDDIAVLESEEVSPTYHPRKMNCRKTYEYRILNRKIPLPKERDFAYFYYYPLDLEKMRKAAECLIGEHDFTSFCTPRTDEPDKIRTIDSIDISEENERITVSVTGNGFLYNMVRIIVGTLVKISCGLWPVEKMKEALEGRDRALAGPTAPAHGLTLKSIVEEKELPTHREVKNEHWHYEIDYTSHPEKGIIILHRVDDWAEKALITKLTKQVSRNGCREVILQDETGTVKSGDSFEYFVYRDEGGRLVTKDPRNLL